MKRIEFLAPVEAMRGNLSGNQKLVYDGDKRAYDVTGGGKVAAQNYDNRYIGAKRVRTNLKYFSLKSKSTTDLGENSRLAMAAFGGACSLAKYALTTLSILSSLQQIFIAKQLAKVIPATMKIRNWVQTEVYPMLKTSQASVTISEGETSVTINNPWITGGTGTDVTIPADILAKFNSALS